MIIEPAEPGDRAFVKNSWLRCLRDAPLYAWGPNGPFFDHFGAVVDRLLDARSVLVARPNEKAENGQKDIAAWVCGARDPLAPPAPQRAVPRVDFIYTKLPFRRMGLAHRLLDALGWAPGMPIVATTWTEGCEGSVPGSLIFMPSLQHTERHPTCA